MYTARERVGGGAHANVYKGTHNDLGRDFAIKFIRPSVGDRNFVLEQAKALARVESPYVVQIHSIEEVIDPESGNSTHAIIMQWLEGETLDKVLANPTKPSREKITRIGIGLIMGMKAIHAAELVHGDLHFKNVMVGDSWVKIIDILYYKTLADDGDTIREVKIQHDRNELRSMIGDLLTRIDLETVDRFNRSLTPESSLDDIHTAFADATNPRIVLDIPALIDDAVARVSDSSFVDGDDYANALSDEIHDPVIVPLLRTVIAKGMTVDTHKAFLRVIWERLSPEDQQRVCVDLSAALNREVPSGSYPPHLRMLSAFGAQGWNALSKATSLRLENAIIDEFKNGAYHAQTGVLTRGALGTWIRYFYPYFKNQNAVRAAFNLHLRGGWTGQNYVGQYHMAFLRRVAVTEADREELIQGLAEAVNDNAWTIKAKLDWLPDDWQREIKRLTAGSDDAPPSAVAPNPSDGEPLF